MTNQQAQNYSVILTYQDGSQFECAAQMTLIQAVAVKNKIKAEQEKGRFSYCDVNAITIVRGWNND
ncbi:hypothetical protein ACLSZ3_05770 [Avibacterium gallinarum]|uniref:hypothetical protein n=1 Tax=Avibacterium gallinarum TaxID=755 RepID=UPI003BF83818